MGWLDMYVRTFSAHLDAYVRDSRLTIQEPLTAEVALAAFKEGFSISGYLAVREGDGFVTHVGALDFDTEEGLTDAGYVQVLLEAQSIPSLLVESRRGAHLWVLCQHNIPAMTMHRALLNALKLCALENPEHIEVFPKRSVNAFGVGALRLPLMRHPKTGLRYPVHDPFLAGGLIEKVPALVLLAASSESPVEALRALAGPEVGDTPYPRWTGPLRLSRSYEEETPSAVQLLAALGVEARPGRGVRCPFHDDAHASLNISADDERVWCHAPECWAYNDGRGVGSIDLERHLRKEPRRSATENPRDSQRVFGDLP